MRRTIVHNLRNRRCDDITLVCGQALEQVLFFAQEPQGISDRVVGYESYISGQVEYRGVGVTG